MNLRPLKEIVRSTINKYIQRNNSYKFYKQKLIAGNYLPLLDKSFEKWIDFKGNYQNSAITKAIKLDKSNKDLAIDIGANVGLITRILTNNYDLVLGIEPSSKNRAAIFRNQSIGKNNLIIFPFAVSDRNGTDKLGISDTSCGANSLLKTELSNPDFYEEIKLIKLDDLVLNNKWLESRRVNLIKIDIQGYELQALKGATEIIKNHKPIILCEVETKKSSNEFEIETFLSTFGYKKVNNICHDRIFKCED